MLNELIERYPVLSGIKDDITKATKEMITCYESGGKVLLCGNGGSCADCDHIVGELMKCFKIKSASPKNFLLNFLKTKNNSSKIRKMLDNAGLTDCRIVVSNSLDEYIIRDILMQGAQVDAFGVGERITREDIAVILHSGGTTGTPKNIVLTNGNFTSLVEQAKIVFKDITPGDRALGILPIFHGFGLAVNVYALQCLGCKVVLLPQFDAGGFKKLLVKQRPNIILGVPTLYEALLKINDKDFDLSFIKVL